MGSQTAGAHAGSGETGEGWKPVECCISILSKLLIYWFSVNHDPEHFGLYFDYSSKWGKIHSKHFLRDRESFMTMHPNLTSTDFWFTQIRENKRWNTPSRATISCPGCQWRQVPQGTPPSCLWGFWRYKSGKRDLPGDGGWRHSCSGAPSAQTERAPATTGERQRGRPFSSLYPPG